MCYVCEQKDMQAHLMIENAIGVSNIQSSTSICPWLYTFELDSLYILYQPCPCSKVIMEV